MKRFSDPPSTTKKRAVQIWPLLIEAARNRQTVLYGTVAAALGYGGAGVIGQMLGPIYYYCQREGLPP